MDWQPIETAPRDGSKFRARGRDFGDPLGKRHWATAKWDARRSTFTDARAKEFSELAYLTDWRPLPA